MYTIWIYCTIVLILEFGFKYSENPIRACRSIFDSRRRDRRVPSSTHGRNRFHPALADLTESPNEPRFKPDSAKRKLWSSLFARRLVRCICIEGLPLRWHWGRGRARDLIELTPDGRHWYRRRTHREPAASELNWVMQMHVSARHALAILEARDYLRQMGLPTDDDPPPCPQSAEDPLGPRSEPDLVAYYQNRVFSGGSTTGSR